MDGSTQSESTSTLWASGGRGGRRCRRGGRGSRSAARTGPAPCAAQPVALEDLQAAPRGTSAPRRAARRRLPTPATRSRIQRVELRGRDVRSSLTGVGHRRERRSASVRRPCGRCAAGGTRRCGDRADHRAGRRQAIPSCSRAIVSSRAGRFSVASSSFSRSLLQGEGAALRLQRRRGGSRRPPPARARSTWRMPTAANSREGSTAGKQLQQHRAQRARGALLSTSGLLIAPSPPPRRCALRARGLALHLGVRGRDRLPGRGPKVSLRRRRRRSGSPGGQVQRPSSVRNASFTARSSSEWKAMIAAAAAHA